MEILILLLIVFGVAALLSRAAARRRRERAEQERRRAEALRQSQGADGPLPSPFEGMPFGGLFESLMTGPGLWSKSYAYDTETGQWVDISDMQPEPEAEPEPEPAPEAQAPSEKRKARRRSRRPPQQMGSLFGGMMGGDGSGEFDVQPPDELIDFDDVGGMDQLKAEVRDSVGLMLEHPDDAERYGSGTGSCCTGRPAWVRRSSPRRSPGSTT